MAVPPGAYVFTEADYMYGAGPLTLRIEVVDHAHPVLYDRDFWLQVDGVQLDYRGAEIGHRSALIRRRCLPTGMLPDWATRSAAPNAGSHQSSTPARRRGNDAGKRR